MTATGDRTALRPFVRTFMHPYAGTQIVWVLIDLAQRGEFPPRSTGPITLAGLARRFSVSRVHVRRIFDDAEREGVARLEQDGEVILTPAGRTQLSIIYGVQFGQLLSAAARTAALVESRAVAA
jgi:DNA-binding GntR family transcriptional regulator